MREQLQQYVTLLFAGAQNCEDIKQEILQNTLDRYDDLIAQGKVPEAAYRLAISSIGDINEILNTKPQQEASSHEDIAPAAPRQPLAALKKNRKLLPIVIAGIVLLCLLALLLEVLDELPHSRRYRSDRGEMPTVAAVTFPIDQNKTEIATLGKAADIHSSPSEDSSVHGKLYAGTQITIQRKENISGRQWAYIDSPIQGWMILENIEYNMEKVQLTPTVSEVITLTEAATVYSSPSTKKGGHNGELEAGTEVSITRRELINNQQWGYTTGPIQGWILMEEQENQKVTVTEPVDPVVYTRPAEQDISGYSCVAAEISAISIDWLSGNIHILAGEGDRISVTETEGENPMVCKQRNGKLSIDFCEESLLRGFRLGGAKAKDLTITVPRDWVCRELEIDAASSDLVMQDLTLQKAEIDAASGRTEFISCNVGSLEIDTASGDVYFVGSLNALECDAASAHFTATLTNVPREIEMSSASGSLDLTLPGDAGFTVRMEGLKNLFSADDFQVTKKNGAYVHGDGSCRIEMESMSGGVYLHKAQ